MTPRKAVLKDGRRVSLRRAQGADVPGLLNLYFRMYRGRYPLALGTDDAATAAAIADPATTWLIAELEGAPSDDRVLASIILACDAPARIGKAMGLVVDRSAAGNRLGESLVRMAVEQATSAGGPAESVYATTRTVDSNPQRILHRAGFLKMGLFPNCRLVEDFETHTLMVYYAGGSLSRRAVPRRLPADLRPLLEVSERELHVHLDGSCTCDADYAGRGDGPAGGPGGAPAARTSIAFEVLDAPGFVRRRYLELKESRGLSLDFYPFHEPNLMLVSEDGSVEAAFHYSRKDSYCVCVGARAGPGHPLPALIGSIEKALRRLGASYLEVLVSLQATPAIKGFLAQRYIPCAYYPAMRPLPGDPQGRWADYVVLAKTFEPFDFRGVHLLGRFGEYLDAYLKVWRKYYIDEAVRVSEESP